MRKLIVASCAVIPTSGIAAPDRQVQRLGFDVGFSLAEEVDLAMDDDALDQPSCRSLGTTCSRNMSFISDGTPGRQANVAPPICIQMPGAVPTRLGSGSAPSGNNACTRLRSGITRLRRANIAAIAAIDSACSHQAAARAFGQGFAGQVILRRPQAAGHDHEIGAVASGSEKTATWSSSTSPSVV